MYSFRESIVAERMSKAKDALMAKDISALGAILESEATDMHGIMLTQKEPLQYFSQDTLKWIAAIRQIRREHGIPVYFTLDAGPNLHLIMEKEHQSQTVALLTDKFGPFPHISSGVAESLHYHIDT
jgi:diphosphomevalonate decarboxylase